jgi:hypothetical protein
MCHFQTWFAFQQGAIVYCRPARGFPSAKSTVARFVIAQTHRDFIDKSCLSIDRNLRQLFARYFRTAFENNLDKRPRRWVSRLQRYDRGRYRDKSRFRNKLQKLSFIRK